MNIKFGTLSTLVVSDFYVLLNFSGIDEQAQICTQFKFCDEDKESKVKILN